MLGGLISAEDEEEIQRELDELQEQEVYGSLVTDAVVSYILLTLITNFAARCQITWRACQQTSWAWAYRYRQ